MKRLLILRIFFSVTLCTTLFSLCAISAHAVESKFIKKIQDGTDKFIDISQEGSLITREEKNKDTGEVTTVPIGKNFDYSGKVGADTLETPNFTKMFEEWIWKARQSLVPQSIQDKTDNPDDYYDQRINGRGFFCNFNPDGSPKDSGTTGGGDRSELRSVPLRWINYMEPGLRQLRLVSSPLGPEEGIEQHFNDYTMDLANPPGCTDDDLARIVRGITTGFISTGSISSAWQWLNDLFLGRSLGNASVKTGLPRRTALTNFMEIDSQALLGTDKTNRSAYGTVEGKLPETFAPYGAVVPGSTVQKSLAIGATVKEGVELNFDYARATEETRMSLLCTLVPASLQKTLGITNHCGAMPDRTRPVQDRTFGMKDPDYVPLPGQEELCGGENACDAIGSVTPVNYNCGYTSADVASIEGPAQLKNDILKASNLSGIPPKILATALTIENRGGVSIYSKDKYIEKTGGEATRCGTVGPMGISYSCQVDASCAHAADNWQTWCKYKGYAGAARGNTSYDPNPRNVADALAVGAGILRGWEKLRATKYGRTEKGCGGWTVEDAKELEHLYFAGQYLSQGNDQCTGSTAYRDENLYNILEDSIGAKAGNYDTSKAGTLTVCEFVEGYYNNH